MIFLECNNDELFIKSLGFFLNQISHERCKGEVVKKVHKQSKAIGVIDEDRGTNTPRIMKNYLENESKGSIKLFQEQDNKQKKLVQVSPYLEHWLLNRAKKNGINPKDFNLPDDPKKLHGLVKLEKNENFRAFLNKLIDIDNEIRTLRKWLEEALE